VILLNVNDNL